MIAGEPIENLLSPPQPLSEARLAVLRRRLQRHSFAGGQDNIPALENAWDLASATNGGAVLWVHEPLPALLSPETGLRQRLDYSLTGTRFFELQTRSGPDRLVEKMDGLASMQHVPRLGTLAEDLTRILGVGAPRFELVRERISNDVAPGVESRVSRHIERLWARDEALRLAAGRRQAEAAALAAKNQLVTPLTGAVVLETQEQFAAHNLTPADATTVPAVPEPQAAALAALALVLWRLARRPRLARARG
jgi:hypothetical protein